MIEFYKKALPKDHLRDDYLKFLELTTIFQDRGSARGIRF